MKTPRRCEQAALVLFSERPPILVPSPCPALILLAGSMMRAWLLSPFT